MPAFISDIEYIDWRPRPRGIVNYIPVNNVDLIGILSLSLAK